MGYAFDRDETVPEAVRRITDEQVEGAASALERVQEHDLEATVHDCRKRAKKLRGLLRLVRPALGRAYGPANQSFRDGGASCQPFATLMPRSPRSTPSWRPLSIGSPRAVSASCVRASPRPPTLPAMPGFGGSGSRPPRTCSARAGVGSAGPSSTPAGGRRSGPASRGPTGPAAGPCSGPPRPPVRSHRHA